LCRPAGALFSTKPTHPSRLRIRPPQHAKPARIAIPDCAKTAQSGSPGVGGPGALAFSVGSIISRLRRLIFRSDSVVICPVCGFYFCPIPKRGHPILRRSRLLVSASAKGGLIAANVTCWEKGTSPKIEALMLPTLCVHSDSNAPREIAGRKGWGTHGLTGNGNCLSQVDRAGRSG